MSEAAKDQTPQKNEESSRPQTNEESTKSTNEASSKPTDGANSNSEPSKPTDDKSSKPTEGIDSPSSKPRSSQPPDGTDYPSSKPTEGANSSTNVSQPRTVKVTNLSVKTEKTEIEQFFSFSGDINYVEMKKENDSTQLAFVTYKDPKGAETAICLSGATLYDNVVTITIAEEYKLPPDAPPLDSVKVSPSVQKAEDVVATMLARGFILGKDAVKKAKDFDEQQKLSSKVRTGAAAANLKAKEMDQKYQVSEKTRKTGTAIMSNKYVLAGAAWVSSAYSAVAKRAEEVSAKTKEKVEKAERERQEKLAAMSPKTREKAEKAEKEKAAAEEAKAKEESDSPKKTKEYDEKEKEEAGDEKEAESKSAEAKESVEKEKNASDDSKPSNSGDGKAENK